MFLCFTIERLIAWHSIARFNTATYDARLDFSSESFGYTADTLNLREANFELMIGFDQIFTEDLGTLEFSIVTFGSDGEIMRDANNRIQKEILLSQVCDE